MKSAYIFHQLNQVYAWSQANMYVHNSCNVLKTDSSTVFGTLYLGAFNFVTRHLS